MSVAAETSTAAAAAAAAVAGSVPLQVKKLSDKGRAPTRGSAFAAGYDLYRCVTWNYIQ